MSTTRPCHQACMSTSTAQFGSERNSLILPKGEPGSGAPRNETPKCRPRRQWAEIPLRSPVSAHRDQPLCAKCRHFAAFRARPDSVCVRLGLAGWGGRIRTSASHAKLGINPLLTIDADTHPQDPGSRVSNALIHMHDLPATRRRVYPLVKLGACLAAAFGALVALSPVRDVFEW